MDDIKITSFPCGQGDSIVIEYADNGCNKIGIIDCNVKNNNVRNVFDYIVERKYTEVDFIFMTHPHSDHYSGLSDLLNRLDGMKKKVYVNNFFSSIGCVSRMYSYTQQQFVESIHEDEEDVFNRIRLYQLLNILSDKNDSGLIKTKFDGFQYTSTFRLNEIFDLYCISPAELELNKFSEMERKKRGGTFTYARVPKNNPFANYMSITLLLLNRRENKVYALFCSDSTKVTLKRILNMDFDFSKLSLVQIPHHGSSKNHYKKFWDANLPSTCYSFLSVGRNTYGHPSNDVVNYFVQNSADFDATVKKETVVFNDDIYNVSESGWLIKFNHASGKKLVYLISKTGDCRKV